MNAARISKSSARTLWNSNPPIAWTMKTKSSPMRKRKRRRTGNRVRAFRPPLAHTFWSNEDRDHSMGKNLILRAGCVAAAVLLAFATAAFAASKKGEDQNV